MLFINLPTYALIMLAIPAFINLWAIWHAVSHQFSSDKERFLWILVSVFVPFIGGIIYLIFGMRHSQKKL